MDNNRISVVLVSGYADGCGKTTLARNIVNDPQVARAFDTAKVRSLAYPLKQMLGSALRPSIGMPFCDLPKDEATEFPGFSVNPRELMRYWGEVGREYGLWIGILTGTLRAMRSIPGKHLVVVDDVRFLEEKTAVRVLKHRGILDSVTEVYIKYVDDPSVCSSTESRIESADREYLLSRTIKRVVDLAKGKSNGDE